MKTQLITRMPRRIFVTALPVAAIVCAITSASAAPTYGVSASGQASYSITGTTPVSNTYTTGAFIQQTTYSQAAGYGGQVASGANLASASILQQYSSYGQLHESSQASSAGTGSAATVSAYLAWLDTISFVGAPVGTNVTIQLTNVYNGTFNLSGGIASGTTVQEAASLTNASSNINFVNPYTANQSTISGNQVGQLTTTVGSTLTLEEQLTEFISGTGTFSGSANFANTEVVYLTVLTPGISIVSASGANYSVPAATSTPEPAALLLVAGGMLAVGAFRKRASL